MSVNGYEKLPLDLQEALKKCDLLIDTDQLEFLYQLYDPRTGGFYHSISSRDTEEMTPCAEGTRFAIEALRYGGIELPDWEKEKVGNWILNHQEESDGFFYEDMWGKITSGSRLNRDLTYSVSILRDYCGMEPKYTLPVERIKNNDISPTIPDYLKSEETMLAYLNSLDWGYDKIWSTGNNLTTARPLIYAAGYEKLIKEYVTSKINPETGLLGDGFGWMNTNGSMKLSGFFDLSNPYPNIEKAIDTVIRIFETCPPPSSATHIWNPFVFLDRVISSQGEGREEARALLLEKGGKMVSLAVDCALKLRKPDGGFSSSPNRAINRLQGYLFGLGLPNESDLDGTLIAGPRLRNTIHEVFGVKATFGYYKELEADFWNRCKNKAPIVKKFKKPDEPLAPNWK